jgi:hypothetical protein
MLTPTSAWQESHGERCASCGRGSTRPGPSRASRTWCGPTGRVRSLEVGGRLLQGLRVAICDECGMPGSDGLLGLDVQEPLGMSLQPGLSTVRFGDCAP